MSSDILKLMSLDNPVFKAYLFYSSILVLKVIGMIVLIGKQRFTKRVYTPNADMSSNILKLMSLDNPVFKAYLFYSSILVLKVIGMLVLIAKQRFTKRIFTSPEDCTILKGSKVQVDDPDIERPRRAHLNDLENIPVFFVAAFAYLLTNPPPWLAINLFRVFTIARVVHTFVYAVVIIPQPARFLAFGVGYGITFYMTLTSIKEFY